MKSIRIQNISYTNILNNISFEVELGHHISIIGGVAAGKSTLCNILNNKVKYEGSYLINDEKASKTLVKENISIINNKYLYDNDLVVDILFDELNDEDEVKKVVKNFNINSLLNTKLEDLNKGDRYYFLIILSMIKNNRYLVIDDVFCYLKKSYIDKIYKNSKKYNVSIINISSSLDYVLYSEYVIFLYNGIIAMEGNTIDTLKEEKLIKRLGFKLPFMYDLALQLNYYEVLDDIFIDKDKMVDEIWK